MAPTTEVSIGPGGLQFHYLWPGSPTLPEATHRVRWDEISAVAVRKRAFGDQSVSYIDFYLEDGSYDISDQPWIAGWEQVMAELPVYLPSRMADWRERFAARQPEDKPLLIFLRGSELPAILQEECDYCGSRWEFEL